MRAAELGCRRVAIWGLGREGRAAISFLRKHHANLPLLLLADAMSGEAPETVSGDVEYASGADEIERAIERVDVIVKSPGVSLYRREIQSARDKGVQITSLLNLWFAEQFGLTTICVTGTKGKSTTASLITHIFERLGRKAALAGNIGVPIAEIGGATAEFAVIEVSSYQAADFDGICDVAVLTSLYPEHIDWHLTLENYFRDKINLLSRGKCQVINRAAAAAVARLAGEPPTRRHLFNDRSGLHFRGTRVFDGDRAIGEVPNPYLARPHNRSNLSAALAVMKSLGIDPKTALDASGGFRGLAHRQEELGELEGVLFVDDSISTIPESTLAALAVYKGRDVTLIVGGYDRGIEYGKLVAAILGGAAKTVICLGNSGERIYSLAGELASQRRYCACNIHRATSMEDAVLFARRVTSPGGVVLLSPAAPSYGQYRDYVERGHDFAAKAGLRTP